MISISDSKKEVGALQAGDGSGIRLSGAGMPVDEARVGLRDKLTASMAEMNSVLYGKELQVKYALCCVLAGGHLLVEDLPGVGKTTLAQLLARVLGLGSQRVQFTSDLLPSDIVGVSVYDQENKRFKFLAGPVFTQVLIADEINRTTPKTQSALLEAMAEFQVTVEGARRDLPSPFFVVATQNPEDQVGTYALPESQMDRFLMRIGMGYPDAEAEKKLLGGEFNFQDKINTAKILMKTEDVIDLQKKASEVKVPASLIDYIQRLLAFTREERAYTCGISPRGGLALIRAVKAWALLEGRRHVEPEDVKALIPCVWSHRLTSKDGKYTQQQLIQHLLNSVPIVV